MVISHGGGRHSGSWVVLRGGGGGDLGLCLRLMVQSTHRLGLEGQED